MTATTSEPFPVRTKTSDPRFDMTLCGVLIFIAAIASSPGQLLTAAMNNQTPAHRVRRYERCKFLLDLTFIRRSQNFEASGRTNMGRTLLTCSVKPFWGFLHLKMLYIYLELQLQGCAPMEVQASPRNSHRRPRSSRTQIDRGVHS